MKQALGGMTMPQLFEYSIYVNASPQHLQEADRGARTSLPIIEGKPWTTGAKFLAQAKRLGEELPLVFGYCAPLIFWATARGIAVNRQSTEYTFANLRPLPRDRYRRSDLVLRAGSPLPDSFIKSYALVRTPDFLVKAVDDEPDEPDELVGLEGEALVQMRVHRRREGALRSGKLAEALKRGDGHLRCEVPGCGFDFLNAYGPLGSGYAHVHHLRPLAEYRGIEETRLEDLAIVCANCHAMIHRGGECRRLDELIKRRA